MPFRHASIPPALVEIMPPMVADPRAAMFLVGLGVGAALLGAGLYVIGDLETVLAYAGVTL